MPYGIPNEKPEQTRWMERCVTGVLEGNPDYDKSRAIGICKGTLKKRGWKVPKESESELSVREEAYELEKKIRESIEDSPGYEVGPTRTWVADIYDEYLVIERGNDLYKVPYTMEGDDVKVDWGKAVEVERRTVYEPVTEEEESSDRTLVPQVKTDGGRVITYGGRTLN